MPFRLQLLGFGVTALLLCPPIGICLQFFYVAFIYLKSGEHIPLPPPSFVSVSGLIDSGMDVTNQCDGHLIVLLNICCDSATMDGAHRQKLIDLGEEWFQL